MKYETPELTVLTPAINAVQSLTTNKNHAPATDSAINSSVNDPGTGYADWE